MKTEFVDVNETRKNVRVEIPSEVVDDAIERVARDTRARHVCPAPARQDSRARHQAELQGSDPPRVAQDLVAARMDEALREPASKPSTRRTSATQHRGGPPDELHGVVRHGARR